MRSYQDTARWHDDISGPQREALRLLAAKAPDARVYALDLRGVRLPTLRALHRHRLIRSDTDIIRHNSIVTITPSGRESVSGDN